jgi:Septum formation
VALLHRSSGRHDSVVADERGGERPARRSRTAGNPAGAGRTRKSTAPVPVAKKAVANKAVAKKAVAKKAVVKRAVAKKAVAKKAVVKKAAVKKVAAVNPPAAAPAKKVVARRATAKKAGVGTGAAFKKVAAERAAAKKTAPAMGKATGTRRTTAARRPIGRLRTPILADLPRRTEDVDEAPPDQIGQGSVDLDQLPPPPSQASASQAPAAETDAPQAGAPETEAPPAEPGSPSSQTLPPPPPPPQAAPAPAPAPPSAPAPPARKRSRARLALAVVGLVALAVVIALVVAAVAGPSGVKYDELQPGDCLEKPGDRFVRAERVDCAEPHDLEVFALVTDPAPRDARYPGPEILEREATVACLPQFQAYVGIPFEQSELRFTGYVPTERNWEEDNRLLVCTLSARTGRLTGTVKDSRR